MRPTLLAFRWLLLTLASPLLVLSSPHLLAGCGDDEKQVGSSIDYRRSSGGVAGGFVQVHVELDGRVLAEGSGAPAECRPDPRAQLPRDRLAALKQALAAADLPGTESRETPSGEAPEREIES